MATTGPSQWRDELRWKFTRAMMVGGLAITALVWLTFDRVEHLPALLTITSASALIGIAGLLAKQFPGPTAAVTASLILFAGCFSITAVGWLPGPVIGLSVVIVAIGVLFGRTPSALAGLLAALTLGAIGYGMSHGLLAVPSAHPSMARGDIWLRVSITAGICWLAFAAMTAYAVELIEHKVRAQQLADNALASERQVRLQVERSRDRAAAAFVEAQRQETIAALVGGLAHDFNNTLMVIMSWTELVNTVGDDEPELVAEAQAGIATAAEQASRLARQLLNLGRRDEATPEPVDLSGVLALTVASLRKLVPPDIEIKLESRPVPPILAEPSQLQQIILNLAINARDAMPEGGRLEFEILNRGDWVGFAVRDSGVGMSAETQARVFEPFFTTKAVGKGTGLGLASVRTIVGQLGGELELESTLGEGTRFELRFPARPDLTQAKTRVRNEDTARCEGRALVVENEPRIREFMVQTLSSMGLEVEAARDGDEALETIVNDASFDLVCTDGVMPGASPASFIAKALERSTGCQILVCSGHLPDDLVRRKIALGDFAFLPKPFGGRELRRQVRAVLGSGSDEVESNSSTLD